MSNDSRRLMTKLVGRLFLAGFILAMVHPSQAGIMITKARPRDDVVEVNDIEGVGVDYQSALNDAFRMAIAKGKGAKIWARTLIDKAVTASDTIDTFVNGFIEDFEIGPHGEITFGDADEFTQYRLKLTRAKVHLRELPSDESVPTVLRRSGNPAYILVSAEKWTDEDGKTNVEQEWKVATDYLKEQLNNKGFRIIEEGLWSDDSEELENALGKDTLKACAIARKHNADLVIFLNAKATYKGFKPGAMSSIPKHNWTTRLKTEAVTVYEKEVFAIKTKRQSLAGDDFDDSREDSIKKAVSGITDDFIGDILKKTNRYNNNGFNVQVRVEGHVTGDTISTFKAVFSTLPGVLQVNVKASKLGDFLNADVICLYNAEKLYNLARKQLDAEKIYYIESAKDRIVYRAK